MTNKEQDYEQALRMIDMRIAQFIDIFYNTSTISQDNITGLSDGEILLMHLQDELSVLNMYGIKRITNKEVLK